VLAESVALLPATLLPTTARSVEATHSLAHRSAALSIRVSAQEQALIKMRAAEANLSVSAYLRQCAFEVEHLRAQAEQTFAARFRTPTPPQFAPVHASGFLVRLARRLFWGKTTTLALRA
jgi:hypothetical protein